MNWSWEIFPNIFLLHLKYVENALGHLTTAFSHSLHCVAFVVLIIYLFSSPSSLPVDPGAELGPVTDYFPEDPYLSAEQPGKQTPFDHSYIAQFFLSKFLH